MLEVSTYSEKQIEPVLPLLQEWGEREFIKYPYLWVPPKGEIFIAYTLLAKEKDSLVVVVRKQGHVVGVAAGVPFDAPELQVLFNDEDAPLADRSLLKKIQERGLDPSQIFYMSYFVTAPECHNDPQLVQLIYDRIIDHLRSIGKTQLSYFEDLGDPDHPLKPENPIPIEPWGVVIHGFKSANLQRPIFWPTLQIDGSVKDEVHQIDFFIKDI